MPQRDEWSEGREMECDHCRKWRPCILAPDPFVLEIRGKKTEETYWCFECHRERKRDI